MLYPTSNEKLAVIRIDEMIKDAQENRRAKQLRPKRTFRLPQLSSLFAEKKSERPTAVATQAR